MRWKKRVTEVEWKYRYTCAPTFLLNHSRSSVEVFLQIFLLDLYELVVILLRAWANITEMILTVVAAGRYSRWILMYLNRSTWLSKFTYTAGLLYTKYYLFIFFFLHCRASTKILRKKNIYRVCMCLVREKKKMFLVEYIYNQSTLLVKSRFLAHHM